MKKRIFKGENYELSIQEISDEELEQYKKDPNIIKIDETNIDKLEEIFEKKIKIQK